MSFDVLGVRSIDDSEIGDSMYPAPSAQTPGFVTEARDGTGVQHLTAKALSSKLDRGGSTHTLVAARKIKADIAITDQRVVVSCEKYEKGGGWVGSAGVMITANAVSKVLAARRRRGKILVGHVRYQWLHTIAFLSRGGLIKYEHVRLGIIDGTVDPARPIAVDIELPSNLSAAKVALEILTRASALWLSHEAVPPEHRDAFRALPASPPGSAESGGDTWSTYRLPFYLPATPATALLAGNHPNDAPGS